MLFHCWLRQTGKREWELSQCFENIKPAIFNKNTEKKNEQKVAENFKFQNQLKSIELPLKGQFHQFRGCFERN